jgi:hypothetical protein
MQSNYYSYDANSGPALFQLELTHLKLGNELQKKRGKTLIITVKVVNVKNTVKNSGFLTMARKIHSAKKTRKTVTVFGKNLTEKTLQLQNLQYRPIYACMWQSRQTICLQTRIKLTNFDSTPLLCSSYTA